MEPAIGIIFGVRCPDSLQVIGIRVFGLQVRVGSLNQERAVGVVRTSDREIGVNDCLLEFERRSEELRQGRDNEAFRISRANGEIVKGFVAYGKLRFDGLAELGVIIEPLRVGEVERP